MKDISILIKERPSWYADQIKKEAKKMKLKINFLGIKDLNDLKNFSKSWGVVFWRSADINRYYGKSTALELLKNNGSHIVNLANLHMPFITHKLFQQKTLEKSGIVETIPTFTFLSKEELKKSIKKGILKFPFIGKPNIGSQGDNIFLFKKEDDINKIKIDTKEYIFQNFMENDGDYRVLMIGGKSLGIIKRKAKKNSFLNNVSKGGTTERVTDKQTILNFSNIGERIAAKFELGFCGIDLIVDKKNGKLHFLELNTAAQWKGFQKTTKINVSRKLLEYFKELLGREEEKTFNLVKKYYESNIDSLLDRKFHYLSRIHLWSGGRKFKKEIRSLKDSYLGKDKKERGEKIEKRLESVSKYMSINNIKRRKSFLSKYQDLIPYSKILFMSLFSESLYNENIKEDILRKINKKDLLKLAKNLHKDYEGIFVLSTYAINYFYMLEEFLNRRIIKPRLYLKILKKYTKNETEDILFAVYLVTHCIIGESRFYSRRVSRNKFVYGKMLKFVEGLILENFFNVSIDCKLEFLVCCKLLRVETILEKIIEQEAENSLSPIGNYLIEKNNIYGRSGKKNSFRDSEHRNVLYLMAFSKYER